MKRFSILAAAVLSLFGIGFALAPVAEAADPCGGVRVKVGLGTGEGILDLCIPDDIL